MHLWIRTALFL